MTSSHKVIVITGASAGLGRAIVQAFAERYGSRARIGLLARGEDGLEGARLDVEKFGGQALVIPTDVSVAEEVEAAAEFVEQSFGPIDVWVNDAMVSVFSPVSEMRPEEFKRVTEVTYLGYVYGTLAALKRMRPRNHGVIVQVGSALAYRSIPLQSAYCAAKHAIVGFTDSLRSELLHDRSKVHVTVVQMPALNTPQFDWSRSRMSHEAQPVPPIFEPEIGAKAVVWASEHRRREVWVGLPTWKAIIGQKLIPGWLDRYLARTAYQGQQTSVPAVPDRPDNLWQPLRGDRGAHGRFDDRAINQSLFLNLNLHRGWALAAVGTALAGLWMGARSLRNHRHVSHFNT